MHIIKNNRKLKNKTIILFIIYLFLLSHNLSAEPTFINTYSYQDLFPTEFTFGGSHCCNVIEAVDGGFILEAFINANWDTAWYPQAMFFKISEDGELEWRKTIWDEEWDGPYFNSFISNGVDRYYGVGDYFGGPTFFYVFDDSCNVVSQRILGEEISLNVEIFSMKLLDDGIIMAGKPDDATVALILKTDFEGNVIWVKDGSDWQVNGENPKTFNSIIKTFDNGLLACGFKESNPQTGYLIEFNSQGDTLWTEVQDYHKFHSVLEYDNETIYTIYSGDDHAYLSKYDQDGNYIEEFEIGTYLFDQVTSSRMLKSNDGNIIILYNLVEGEIHKVTPEGEIMWSRDYLYNGQPVYPDYIGVSDNKGYQHVNGDYIYCGTTNTGSNFPELLLLRINADGLVSVGEETLISGKDSKLLNYPNPFNPETTIKFSLPEDSKVKLTVYNIRGQKVKTLVNDGLEKGIHEVIWAGKNDNNKSVASGVYFYKFDVNDKTKSVKKCLMLK